MSLSKQEEIIFNKLLAKLDKDQKQKLSESTIVKRFCNTPYSLISKQHVSYLVSNLC